MISNVYAIMYVYIIVIGDWGGQGSSPYYTAAQKVTTDDPHASHDIHPDSSNLFVFTH
jgi:hypothetical protein